LGLSWYKLIFGDSNKVSENKDNELKYN
jgi:hypothetical protein